MTKFLILTIFFALQITKGYGYIVIGEKLNYKLLYKVKHIADVSVKKAIQDYRYVVLNRGSSDGIYEGDHFSFYRNANFAFRGVVLQVETYRSLWLTYHNYKPSILEINSDFVGKKIHLGLIPKRVTNIKRVLSADTANIFAQYKNEASEDTQEVDDGNRELVDNESIRVIDRKKVFEFNPDLELEEIIKASKGKVDYFSWGISASPISFSRVPKTKDIGYSINASCLICENTTLDLVYSYTHSTEKPPRSEFSEGNDAGVLTSSSYNATIDFNFNNFWRKVSYWASLSWSRARQADVVNNEPIYSPEYLWSGIPLGLTYNFIATSKIPEFSLSYGLQWDLEKVNFIDIDFDDNFNEIKKKATQKTQKTRHSIKLYLNWLPFENFSVSNTFWYKPFHDFANKEFDWRDSGPFTNNLSISYRTSFDVSLTYTNDVTWDEITKQRDGTPSTNMINSFQVTYNFNF